MNVVKFSKAKNLNSYLKLVDVSRERGKNRFGQIDSYKNYTFHFNNKSNNIEDTIELNLHVGFDVVAYTDGEVPIYNFGYGLDILTYDSDYEDFMFCNVDSENGRSTKKYFDDKLSREIINKYVRRCVEMDIKKYNFNVIVRGPLTTFKRNNSRYTQIDEIIKKLGYKKVVYKLHELNNFIPHSRAMESENDEYWFYIRKGYKIDKYDLCNLNER